MHYYCMQEHAAKTSGCCGDVTAVSACAKAPASREPSFCRCTVATPVWWANAGLFANIAFAYFVLNM